MLPRDIVTENWPDRATYDLPRRPIGKLHLFGLPLIGFAILFAWSPGHEVASLVRKVMQGNAGAGDWLVGGFTFLFVAAAVIPFGIGMFILLGRTRIVMTPRRIRIIECAGPLRWSRNLRCDSVIALELGYAKGALQTMRQDNEVPAELLALGALIARKRFGKPVLLVLGYPRDLLDPLAAELTSVLGNFGQRVAVKEVSSQPRPASIAAFPEIREKPISSNIQIRDHTGGADVQVPSLGLFKQSHGLFVFGILWCLMTAAFSFVFARGHLRSMDVGTLLFGFIFWGLGLGMLGFGLHLGTCRWSLRADSQGLEATRTSALRKRSWKWARSELARIAVGPSNISVNEQPLQELQIFSRSGVKRGVLRGRAADELAWVAFSLNQALRLDPGAVGVQASRAPASERV